MLFNSYAFIFVYLPTTLVVSCAIARINHRYVFAWGIVAALIFYSDWSAPYIPLLVASLAFNYVVGGRISRAMSAGRKRLAWWVLALAIAVNLLVLARYKYAHFFGEIFEAATGVRLGLSQVELPLGISFFTFTQIAYLVDARQGRTEERGPTLYALFVTFFPHLIAGPILHHREMMRQFLSRAAFRFRSRDLALGMSLFVVGLAKKVLLADSIAPVANSVFGLANDVAPTIGEAWLGALAYTMQIYFDFSGYSDMALGLACMMGVRLPLNFNSPYKATSIIDFWRRWHMTLSRFLKDYLYIPLGGNRRGEARRLTNLMITMALGGLWHGAAWTFVIWGSLHGVYLVVNHGWRAIRRGRQATTGTGLALSRLLTFAAVVVAWVFFRSDSLPAARNMLSAMFGGNGFPLPTSLATWLSTVSGAQFPSGAFAHGIIGHPLAIATALAGMYAIVVLLPNSQQMFARDQPAIETVAPVDSRLSWRPGRVTGIALGLLFAVCIMRLGGESPFLYFRF